MTQTAESAGAQSSGRWLGALLAVAAIAQVVPLFTVEVLPFTDVPEHLAVMSSLRHYFDPSFKIAETYELALGRSQYLLYHSLGAALSFVTSVDLANRLLLAAAGLAQPFAARSLLRALGRDERLAIFAVPLFWNRALVIGFLPFVASFPVLLYALSLAVRELDEPQPARRRGLAVLAVAIFYLHASAAMLLVTITLALAAHAAWGLGGPSLARARAAIARTRWLLPLVVVGAAWSALGRMTLRGASLADEGEIGRITAFRSVRAFSLWAHDVFRSHTDEGCAIAYWAAFLVLIVLAARARTVTERRTLRPLIPFLCVLALYFLVPFRVGAAAMLNVRMAPVLAALAILPLEVIPGRVSRAALATVFAVSLVTAANAFVETRALVREEAAGVTALFAHTTPGSRLVSLPFDAGSNRVHFPPFIHMGAYHRVVHGGVASYSFSELAHWPLHYREGRAPPTKPQSFWSLNPCLYRNAEDGPYYDYVLVKGRVDPFRDAPPGPVFRLVDQVKDFRLYAKAPGETWPAWPAADRGPCVRRDRALGEAAAAAAEPYPAD